MRILVAGIRYLDEVYSLILKEKNNQNKENMIIDKLNFSERDVKFTPRHYNIVILTDRDYEGKTLDTNDCISKMKSIISSITPSDFIICNVDDKDLIRHLAGVKCRFITYGYSQKAQITTSSAGDSITNSTQYLCSLQSNLRTVKGDMIEPGEILVEYKAAYDAYPALAYCGFLLVSGLKKT